ncbi:DUF58 domain-containing protein [Azohydromonas caseinilytica]|uniref:DUF58 domain-containing protein n=1 Tax=Azohydromonas caseinilytica TaxID=2728836 RepID=A0A848FDN1_9BURK|nr:DUF58 domain-containing protein [Azohydromonas caseinilytica]NML17412.1 DUF58 domain-containing protein [Azohydromonas caseinilytica]
MIQPPPEFHYRLPGPAQGLRAGAHRSLGGEGGLEFRGHADWLRAPDARRLDVRATLRDPFQRWQVRLHSPPRAQTVWLIADVSASMAFGAPRRLDVLADFARSLAWSAWRTGDPFGCVACDDRLREELLWPPARQAGRAEALGSQLRALRPERQGSRALAQAAAVLGASRGLLFLVSDFHVPLEEVRRWLDAFVSHWVVPVVLWDRYEFEPRGPAGLLPLVDAESGARRLLWWRPGLRERWAQAGCERREALQRCFAQARLRPLFIEGAFDADAVTRHFLQG